MIPSLGDLPPSTAAGGSGPRTRGGRPRSSRREAEVAARRPPGSGHLGGVDHGRSVARRPTRWPRPSASCGWRAPATPRAERSERGAVMVRSPRRPAAGRGRRTPRPRSAGRPCRRPPARSPCSPTARCGGLPRSRRRAARDQSGGARRGPPRRFRGSADRQHGSDARPVRRSRRAAPPNGDGRRATPPRRRAASTAAPPRRRRPDVGRRAGVRTDWRHVHLDAVGGGVQPLGDGGLVAVHGSSGGRRSSVARRSRPRRIHGPTEPGGQSS